MKIANKISFSFFAIAIILTSAVGTILYLVAREDLQKSIYNKLDTVVASRANHIETYLKMLEISVGQLSKSTVLENFLKTSGKEDIRQGESFEKAMKRLARTKEANPSIAEFLLMDRIGKVIASSNESSVGIDKSSDSFFFGGQKDTYIKDAYYFEAYKEPLIAVSAPFLDSNTGEFLGVIAARVRLNDLNNIVREKTGLGDTGEIYIVNKYGFMVTHSRFKKDLVLKQRVDTQNVREARLHEGREHPLSEKKKINVFPGYRGVQVLGAHEYISQMKWAVLAEIDASEVFRPLVKIRLVFLAILFIVPLTAWLVGIFIAKLITDPLHKLHKGTEIIGSGNLDCKVGTDAKDEVGQLSRAFDEMVENLKKNTTSIENLNKEIAGRKKTEDVLKVLEKKYRSLVENIPDVVWTTDINGSTIFISPNVEKIYGYTPEEIYKGSDETWFDRIHPDDKEKVKRTFIKLFEKKELYDIEYRIKSKDGKWIWLYDRATEVYEKNGIKYADGIFSEITERKKTEEALKESEGKFRAIFDNVNDGILLADTEIKKFYTGNNTACQMLGYSLEEIKNLGVTDIHPEEDLPYVIEQFERQVRKEIAVAKDLPVKRKDGSVFYADVNTSSVALAGRTYLLGIFRDITERKKLEEQLQINKASFYNIVEKSTDGVIVVDKEGIVQFINHAAENLFGHKAEDMIGEMFGFPVVTDEVMELDVIRNGKEPGIAEMRVVETQWEDHGARLALLRDITERKGVEEKLKETIRMKSVFISTVSHELRTPLTAIKGGIDLVLDGLAGNINEEQKEVLDISKKNVDRLTRLINNVLDFQKLNSGKMKFNLEANDINQIVKDVYKTMNTPAKATGPDILLELDTSLPRCSFDSDMITQVLTNLVNNAMKFTEKGNITIKTSKTEDAVLVSVSDTGCGIRKEDISKLFNNFEQLGHSGERKTGGTGLGLAISKEIVVRYGGMIWAESEHGKGSKFTFTLPMWTNLLDNI
jgi:PAS domain S-box-containing protein